MERRYVVALFASLALLGGCDRNDNVPDRPTPNDRGQNALSDAKDRKPVTALEQGNNEADLNVTKEIRQALMEADNLSQAAKNVTVVTSNGVVTLRGTVKDDTERQVIEQMAKARSAGNRVDNQLVFAAQDMPVR